MQKLFTARILLGGALLISVAATAIGATYAYFNDLENSAGNQFDAGVLDLKIDNHSYYNGQISDHTTWELDDLTGHLFFDFEDLKPGDWGEDTISIHVLNNDAYACFDSQVTANDDNGSNEPELQVDTPDDENNNFDGELGQNIDFIFWVDDGDNVLESDEVGKVFAQGKANQVLDNLSVTLADSLNNLFTNVPGQPLVGAQTYYIAKAWCFGNMSLQPVNAGEGVNPTIDGGVRCDGTGLDNSTQTDKLIADVEFSAIQSRNNADFVCDEVPTPSTTPTATPTPTPIISCTESDAQFASSFAENNQGTQRSGAAVLANRSLPSAAFGAPQTLGLPSDSGFPVGSFYSLGFTGGNIVFGFAQPFYPNPSGADLFVYEVTGGVYPDERVTVEVGPTALGPWTIATPNPGLRDAGFEMNTASAQYVRLTEASNLALFPIPQYNDADGYDVDAIKTFCKQQVQ